MEPLQACEDTMPMKALEVSENFLMSTGLGTLQGEGAQGWQARREPRTRPAEGGAVPLDRGSSPCSPLQHQVEQVGNSSQ